MAATPAPEPHEVSAPAGAPDAEPRHLQPVPAESPEPDEPAEGDDGELVEPGEDTDVVDDEPEPGGGVDISWFDWTREVFSPQSGLWTTRPLAPQEVVDRARHGQHVADAGPLRAVSVAHGYVSAGVKITLRGIEWMFFEHLARFVLGLALITTLCLYLLF